LIRPWKAEVWKKALLMNREPQPAPEIEQDMGKMPMPLPWSFPGGRAGRMLSGFGSFRLRSSQSYLVNECPTREEKPETWARSEHG
jgi:hypothetical protein